VRAIKLVQRWERTGSVAPARMGGRKRYALAAHEARPDFNPIEQLFAKLKAILCKAAARTLEALIDAIPAALGAFTPAECANYFANDGDPS